jgi:hypothetical protein
LSAKLRLPRSMTHEAREARVDAVISEVAVRPMRTYPKIPPPRASPTGVVSSSGSERSRTRT